VRRLVFEFLVLAGAVRSCFSSEGGKRHDDKRLRPVLQRHRIAAVSNDYGDPVTSVSLFTSGRERRLWAWTLAVVAAIYSTLGLAGRLAGAVRQDLLEVGVLLCMLLVLATILTQGLKARPGGAEIGVALGIAAAYTLVFLRMNGSVTERTHLMEYGVVGVFIYEALTERASQGRRVPVPALFAMLATTLAGSLDEGIQAILPSRVFDPMDMLFNLLAAVMAVTASAALRWARRRALQRFRRHRT